MLLFHPENPTISCPIKVLRPSRSSQCAFTGATPRQSAFLYHFFHPPYLGEADVCGLLAEALTADVQAVLADQTSLVGADTAIQLSVSQYLLP